MGYSGDLDGKLVLLSVLVAIIASYAAFTMFDRLRVTNKQNKYKWLILSSFIMGVGIWTMHFIGMLAYDTHQIVTFQAGLTLLSLLVAFILSFIGFFIVIYFNLSVLSIGLYAAVMGLAIIGMQNLGMLSMQLETNYNFSFIIISMVIVFIILAVTSFLLFSNWISQRFVISKMLASSFIMGLGMSSLHYISLKSVRIIGKKPLNPPHNTIGFDVFTSEFSPNTWAYGLGFVTTVMISILFIVTYFDKNRAQKQQRVTEVYYRSMVELNPNVVLTVDATGKITDLNAKVTEILNFRKEDLLSNDLFTLFKKGDQKRIEQKFQNLQDGNNKDFETWMKTGEGKWIPMMITFVPIILDHQFVGVFVIARDNRDIVAYQERIKKSQKSLVNTLRKQQGMTLKFIKIGDDFIHTLAEGALFYRLHGNSKQVLGKRLSEFLPEKSALSILSSYNKAWNGEITSFETAFNNIDYYVTLSPVVKNGKVVEVIGSGVDITDRKKAEQLHKQGEKFYRNILSEMAEAILICTEDHRAIPLNNNFYHMFDIPKGDIIDWDQVGETSSLIDENGSPLSQENSPVHVTFKTGEDFTKKVIGIKKNGKNKWFSVNTKFLEPLWEEGTPEVLLTLSDITWQKEQEMKLREVNALNTTLIDSLPYGVIVTDSDVNIIALNLSFCQMFEMKEPILELIGKNMLNDVPVTIFKDKPKEEERYLEILANNQPKADEIVTNKERILKRLYSPFNIDQENKHHLWIFEDITIQRKMERGIIVAKEEAEKSNLAKSDFLSKMSHELRTPLNGILGFSQLLELDQTLSSQQQSFNQEILKGGRHLLSLINEILDLARIETGKLKITKDTFQIGNVIDECVRIVESTAKMKKVSIMSEKSECHEKYVYSDQVRLKQIILNLLDNAIKYNREAGKVEILCNCKDTFIEIHVKDTGVGIPVNEQLTIFEPFYRLDHAHIEGTGIGLALVHQIVQLMGGEVGVSSVPGVGSDFWVRLPLEQMLREKMSKSAVRSQETVLLEESSYQILYIEDQHSNLQLVEQIFAKIPNYSLMCALNGKTGLEIAKHQNPDLILLDLHLPDMSGFDVFQQLQCSAETKGIPVIALSANAMEKDIRSALEMGFKDYVTKPFDLSDLLNVIKGNLSVRI
ncbi:ATP-binding protein [Robertmurraya kyonggiensis]|uniref:histidine kinase n=1 Tax=Robertmurraya kyonggiensis TaxID=1037680 RepID=A0A4U1D0Y7_9BACI|nr:ATP-binding protein [Robertmurraya kyonggiensis]TKC15343.1 PAS domain S-box protein [Robertmurraya kyonggiensis]